MNVHSTTVVPTELGSRYLQQLCKHWSHNLNVVFAPEHGQVIFPATIRGSDFPGDAVVNFAAAPRELRLEIQASSPDQLAAIKGALARHLDRFAFREGPFAYDWRDRDASE